MCKNQTVCFFKQKKVIGYFAIKPFFSSFEHLCRFEPFISHLSLTVTLFTNSASDYLTELDTALIKDPFD